MMIRVFFLMVFIPLGLWAATPTELDQRGRELYSQGKMEEAFKVYQELYKIQPSQELEAFINQLGTYVGKTPILATATPIPDATPVPLASPATSTASPKEAPKAVPTGDEKPKVKGTAPSSLKSPKSLGLTMALALLPGGGHFYLGRPLKGALFTVSSAGLFAVGFMNKSKSDTTYEEYLALEAGSDQSNFDDAYNRYDNLREKANYFFIAATGVYLVSILDAHAAYWVIRLSLQTASSGNLMLVAQVRL